ncbi:hypothetical protein BRC63_00240 [Halobacteriales archaeon QH_10_70_21]|nr:MAG: hypothetical protein BRC63_00240 [Halobacteriales archaeon QH_10_70_21]
MTPSTFPDDATRRRFLAGLGSAAATGLAGCSGRLPGTDPERMDTETVVERDGNPQIRWEYPPRDDADGVGYAAVRTDRFVGEGARRSAVRLEFNSTVGRIAAADPYRGYRADWFRFRVRPPTDYEDRLTYDLRVAPPQGGWEGLGAWYDVQGGARRTTVELRDVGSQGTILIPAVFDPPSAGLPDRLHCSFSVQASRPGAFGRTVRASGRGSLPLAER